MILAIFGAKIQMRLFFQNLSRYARYARSKNGTQHASWKRFSSRKAKPHFSLSISSLKRICVQMAQFQYLDCGHLSANRKLVQVRQQKSFSICLGGSSLLTVRRRVNFQMLIRETTTKSCLTWTIFFLSMKSSSHTWIAGFYSHTRSVSSSSYKEDLLLFLQATALTKNSNW